MKQIRQRPIGAIQRNHSRLCIRNIMSSLGYGALAVSHCWAVRPLLKRIVLKVVEKRRMNVVVLYLPPSRKASMFVLSMFHPSSAGRSLIDHGYRRSLIKQVACSVDRPPKWAYADLVRTLKTAVAKVIRTKAGYRKQWGVQQTGR